MGAVTRDDVWRLGAEESWLITAGRGWTSLATALGDADEKLRGCRRRLTADWEGSRAESYLGYAPSLAGDLSATSQMATDVQGVLTDLHGAVAEAEGRLASSYGRACVGTTNVFRFAGTVTFFGTEDEDPPNVDTEYAVAQGIVEELRETVRGKAGRLRTIAGSAQDVADAWSGPANGDPKWDAPSGASYDVQQTTLGSTTTVTTGDGDDVVTVTIDPETGDTLISISSIDPDACRVHELRIPAGQEVVINTGGGSDTIRVPEGVNTRLRFATGTGDDAVESQQATGGMEVFAGTGDDTVETGAGWDTIHGGAGDDYVDAGGGNDRVLGGDGNDILYGMGGNDRIHGGDGHDYLEGARGDDTLFGGLGDDIISGGFGDDTAHGGDGDDNLYAGAGADSFDAGRGNDKATAEDGDDVFGAERTVVVEIPSEEYYTKWLEFEADGSDAFKERILADLHMMASSETGQTMIEAQVAHYEASDDGWFDFSKEKVTIVEFHEQNGVAVTDLTVKINPDYQGSIGNSTDPQGWSGKPPVVVLFHELGHINQYRSHDWQDWYERDDDGNLVRDADGNLVKKQRSPGQPLIEMQNVGLDWDHDEVPGANGADYDWSLTENGFRDELDLPRRERY